MVNITGPLIRILGDRFSANVKKAVLQTLGLLLGKVNTVIIIVILTMMIVIIIVIVSRSDHRSV